MRYTAEEILEQENEFLEIRREIQEQMDMWKIEYPCCGGYGCNRCLMCDY